MSNCGACDLGVSHEHSGPRVVADIRPTACERFDLDDVIADLGIEEGD